MKNSIAHAMEIPVYMRQKLSEPRSEKSPPELLEDQKSSLNDGASLRRTKNRWCMIGQPFTWLVAVRCCEFSHEIFNLRWQ